MAKIVTNVESTEVEPMEKETVSLNFKDVIGARPYPSLRAIAEVFDVPPQRIYSIAKQPIAGQVYDKNVYNWDAISKFIIKRIGGADDAYKTLEEVYEACIAKDEELGSADRRRGSRGAGTPKVMIDLGDGKQMPARRKEVKLGDTVKLKAQDEKFTVVYLTDTHIVMQVNEGPALTCLSNWTFNQKLAAEKAPEAPVE